VITINTSSSDCFESTNESEQSYQECYTKTKPLKKQKKTPYETVYGDEHVRLNGSEHGNGYFDDNFINSDNGGDDDHDHQNDVDNGDGNSKDDGACDDDNGDDD
jgi:hypothetical protein